MEQNFLIWTAGVLNVVAQGRATYIREDLLQIRILTTHGFHSTYNFGVQKTKVLVRNNEVHNTLQV